MEIYNNSLVDEHINNVLLEDYNKRALERNTEEAFSSDKMGSTKLLLQALFKNYNKSVKIFGTSLCSKILRDEECRKRLDMFEYPVSIILTHSPNDTTKKIKNYFLNNINSNSQIKETTSFVTSQFATGKKEVEFLVLDDLAYFFEHDLKPGEKGARCSFNNPESALHLSKTFDEVYNKH